MSSAKSSLEFLQEKWRQWFKALDVNKDGAVSRQDYKDSLQSFENFYQSRVDEKTLEEMREGFRLFWEEFIFRRIAHKDCMVAEEFVASLSHEYETDPEGLRQLVTHFITAIVQASDADHNNIISYEEYLVIFGAFGHKDEAILKAMYDDYEPTDKGIAFDRAVKSWIDAAIGVDQEEENIAVKGFLQKLD